MKWTIRILVGLLAAFLGLIAIARLTTKYHTAEDLEDLFLENQEAFCEAKNVLLDICLKHNSEISISKKNHFAQSPDSGRHVVQVGSLYFISLEDLYSQEEYKRMYDAVEDLFLSHDLYAISGDTKEIGFGAYLSYGIHCAILYRADGGQPKVVTSLHDQLEIGDGWHAIISTD